MKILGYLPVEELCPSKRLRSAALAQEERDSLTGAMFEDILKALPPSVVREIVLVGAGSMAQRLLRNIAFRT